MTDREKLEAIKKICEDCFPCESQCVDLTRAQALANIYGVIIYDGMNLLQETDLTQDDQITIDEVIGGEDED